MYEAPAAPVATTGCCDARWTGFYGAAMIGWGISVTEANHKYQRDEYVQENYHYEDYNYYLVDSFKHHSSGDHSSDELTGTVAIGFDWQAGDRLVVGVFGDYTFSDLDDDHHDLARFAFDDIWAVGGRVGITGSCCSLWYVTAGYTQAESDYDSYYRHNSEDIDGWFVGAGVETLLAGGFSLKAEYRYSEFDGVNVHDAKYSGYEYMYDDHYQTYVEERDRLDAETEIHAIRIGLAYRFNREEETVAPAEPLK